MCDCAGLVWAPGNGGGRVVPDASGPFGEGPNVFGAGIFQGLGGPCFLFELA